MLRYGKIVKYYNPFIIFTFDSIDFVILTLCKYFSVCKQE